MRHVLVAVLALSLAMLAKADEKEPTNFDSDPPTLTVEAGYSKHRRTDVLPLRKDFAERIRKWIAGKPDVRADEPLLRVTNKRTADMLETDLAAAREKWIEKAHDKAERQRREQSSFLA